MVPVNLLMWAMAFLPIVVLIILMVKFKWGAAEAAAIGLLITVITGLVFYKADLTLIAVESAKGIWNALVIVLIVWTAILMYQVGDEAKAFLVIRNGMGKLLPNELLLVMALGWVFESFLQGITGFGVPVAVGAPLLIGIGMNPIWAVIIPLFGQAWGNTFGTLGAAWDALVMSAKNRDGIRSLYEHGALDSRFPLVLRHRHRPGYLLVLWQRQGRAQGPACGSDPFPDPGRRRIPAGQGEHHSLLLYSRCDLPGRYHAVGPLQTL